MYMANYDFENLLSPLDFEHLCRDLLSKDLKVELSAFADGGDGGVDLRYSSSKGKEYVVVQCKRTKSISRAMLLDEAIKMEKLKPKKYYLAISKDLSVAMVDTFKDYYIEWIDGEQNIYQKSRLNQLLDTYEDVHRKNSKLWLHSSEIFNSLINRDLIERSKSLINEIRDSNKFYVKNNSLTSALEILAKDSFLIISGIPGIGKTTLAKLLLLEYVQNDFEIIEIRKVIEGEKILVEESDAKQVFYFDDFLGENFLKYDVVEGRSFDLIQFIRRIIRNPNKAMIMTTREYILSQAKDTYAKLESPEIDLHKYTLDLSSYTNQIKAQILYNHLYYSNVSVEHIESIISSKAYKKIINHKNYNPRIVEQMTVLLGEVSPEEYPQVFIENLNNPSGVWARAFDSEISFGSKVVLYVLLSTGGKIIMSEFAEALKYFHEVSDKTFSSKFSPLDFKEYIKKLEGTFIKVDMTDELSHYVEFQNPSIQDFLLRVVRTDHELLLNLLKSCKYLDQLTYSVNYLITKENIDDSFINSALNEILTRYDNFENMKSLIGDVEWEEKPTDIYKLHALKPFAFRARNKKLDAFLIDKYQRIEIDQLDGVSEEGKYISFSIDFNKNLSIDFDSMIEKVFQKIRFLGNVRNFLSLNKLSRDKFDKFLKLKGSKVLQKLTDTIAQEVEIKSKKQQVQNVEMSFNQMLEKFEEELTGREEFAQELRAKVSPIFKARIINLESEDDHERNQDFLHDILFEEEHKMAEQEDFNEDDLFKIEMFN